MYLYIIILGSKYEMVNLYISCSLVGLHVWQLYSKQWGDVILQDHVVLGIFSKNIIHFNSYDIGLFQEAVVFLYVVVEEVICNMYSVYTILVRTSHI